MLRGKRVAEAESEGTDPILVCFKILKLVGCWAIDSRISLFQFLYKIYHYFVLTGFSVIPTLAVIDIINFRHDLAKFNYNLTASSGTIMLIFKMLILLHHREKLVKLQWDFQHYLHLPFIGKSKEDKKIVMDHDDKSLKLLKFYFFYLGIPAVTTWCIIPAIDESEEGRITPMRQWWPFDYQKTPIYEIIWVYQCFMLYMYCGAIITLDFIFFCFLPKFCAHFEILKKNLRLLESRYEFRTEWKDSKREEESTYQYLKEMTIHHNEVLRRCRVLDGIYRRIVYIHFAGMAVLMCCTIFDVVLVTTAEVSLRLGTQIQYFTAGTVDTFIYCYHGNNLIKRGNEFASEIYGIPWYRMSPRCKKLVLQMILSSKTPPAMSGGGRFLVNYETFLAVCKLSYNILAILQHMQNS